MMHQLKLKPQLWNNKSGILYTKEVCIPKSFNIILFWWVFFSQIGQYWLLQKFFFPKNEFKRLHLNHQNIRLPI